MHYARTRRGLSQEEVCEAIGISQSTLSQNERTANHSRHTVALAKLYDVDPHWLSDESGRSPPGWLGTAGSHLEPKPVVEASAVNKAPSRRDAAVNVAANDAGLSARAASLAARLDALTGEDQARAFALVDFTLRGIEAAREEPAAKSKRRSRAPVASASANTKSRSRSA